VPSRSVNGFSKKGSWHTASVTSGLLTRRCTDFLASTAKRKIVVAKFTKHVYFSSRTRSEDFARRASVNCGQCKSKRGKSCAAHPVCNEWTLHKFRRTWATLHFARWCTHIRTAGLERTFESGNVEAVRQKRWRTKRSDVAQGEQYFFSAVVEWHPEQRPNIQENVQYETH